jgi:hypothetical protein
MLDTKQTNTEISELADALFGIELSNATQQMAVNGANVQGIPAFVDGVYTTYFGTATTASVAQSVVSHLQLTGDLAITAESFIASQLGAAPPANRGAVLMNILNLYAGMTSDPNFGTSSAAWSNIVSTSETYSGNAQNTANASAGYLGAALMPANNFNLVPPDIMGEVYSYNNVSDNVTLNYLFDTTPLTSSGVYIGTVLINHASTNPHILTVNFDQPNPSSTNTEIIRSIASSGDASIIIHSGGVFADSQYGFPGNAIYNISEADNQLSTVTLDGSANFTLGVQSMQNGISTDTGARNQASPVYVVSSLKTIDASATTGMVTISAGKSEAGGNLMVNYTEGLTIVGGSGKDIIENDALQNGVIVGHGAAGTAGSFVLTGDNGTVNDTLSFGKDVISLGGYNDSAILGSGVTTVKVLADTVPGAGPNAPDTASVQFGAGAATVSTQGFVYGQTASVSSDNTHVGILNVSGNLHGQIISMDPSVNFNYFNMMLVQQLPQLGSAISVSSAKTLDQAVFLADGAQSDAMTWFQYGGNTYLECSGATGNKGTSALPGTANAVVVKLTGLVDLSHTQESFGSVMFA